MIRDKWNISPSYKAASIDILASNLASLRARIRITQEEPSSVVGISRQMYCLIEKGNKKMTWSLYLALVFFFDSVTETSEMLKELRIYPIDLVVRFNEQLALDEILDI